MELTNDAVIKVIGVGGGGGNAVEAWCASASKVLNSSR
jgi:cell division GTPase FtsZ